MPRVQLYRNGVPCAVQCRPNLVRNYSKSVCDDKHVGSVCDDTFVCSYCKYRCKYPLVLRGPGRRYVETPEANIRVFSDGKKCIRTTITDPGVKKNGGDHGMKIKVEEFDA